MHRRICITTESAKSPIQTGNGAFKRNTRLQRRRKAHSAQRKPLSSFCKFCFCTVTIVIVLAVFLWAYIQHSLPHVKDLPILPWNENYRIPESSEVVGDRSDQYVKLRKDVDEKVDQQLDLLLHQVHSHQRTYVSRPMENGATAGQEPYDIYNCPKRPPVGYPFTWKTMDILTAWPTDDVEPPLDDGNNALIYQSLCVFDYERDLEKAYTYREAHKPFIMGNDPTVQKTVARWSMPDYIQRLTDRRKYVVEYSDSNQFLYSTKKGSKLPKGWKKPVRKKRMTFVEWLEHARTRKYGHNDPHWYFQMVSCGPLDEECARDRNSSFLNDELPFFQPKRSIYLADPDHNKGIFCRFGMPGVMAQNHYDEDRNSIVLLAGSRRYILSHPEEFPRLALYPFGHPSARHSEIDWSNPDTVNYPQFLDARSNEVVLQPGQVLYLPTCWFHAIVNLEVNMQCNARSGVELQMVAVTQAYERNIF